MLIIDVVQKGNSGRCVRCKEDKPVATVFQTDDARQFEGQNLVGFINYSQDNWCKPCLLAAVKEYFEDINWEE